MRFFKDLINFLYDVEVCIIEMEPNSFFSLIKLIIQMHNVILMIKRSFFATRQISMILKIKQIIDKKNLFSLHSNVAIFSLIFYCVNQII